MAVFKVLLNLTLAAVILYIVVRFLSVIFDQITFQITSLEGKNRRYLLIAFAVFMLALPWLIAGNPYFLRTLVIVGIYIILALSLNLIIGFAGQLSIGHAAFYAIGAYTTALLTVSVGLNFWLAFVLSFAVAGLFGFLLGVPILRLKGDYLAIATIGFGEIVRLVLINGGDITRGPAGIPGIPSPSILGFTINDNISWFYFIYIMVIITVFISYNLLNSRLGRGLIAIRDDEIAAEAMGVKPSYLKILVFTLGAALAGIAGSMFASYIHYVNPDSFTYLESVTMLMMVVLGGIGSIPGVIVGAAVLAILPEMLRTVELYRFAIYGLLLIIMMIARPQGMISMASLRGGKRPSWQFLKLGK